MAQYVSIVFEEEGAITQNTSSNTLPNQSGSSSNIFLNAAPNSNSSKR